MRWRPFLLIFGSVFGFLGLVIHLYDLQVEHGNLYAVQAASLYENSGVLVPQRGSIYFTDKKGGRIAAVLNKDYQRVFAVPKEIEDVDEAAENLSHILGIDIAILKKKLSKPQDSYELLLTKIDAKTVAQLKEAHIPGVYVRAQGSRFYPLGSLAAHVIGFVAPNNEDDRMRGRYGVEAFYENTLAGSVKVGEKEKRSVQVIQGGDIMLTIDRNIQSIAEEVLAKLVVDHRATGGVVIVEEPKTGKILALGSSPTFDPNEYSSYPISRFLNPAVEAVYEPGSVFKVLTMAAAIDAGKITPQTTYVDTGSLTLNGKTIQNWDKKAHGVTTMTRALENSLNLGAAFAESKMGHSTFMHYLNLFGIEEKTDIGLPGEVVGSLKSLGTGARDINFATVSFGQGVSVTPMRLIETIAAIANDGVMMRPYILASQSPQEVRRVVSVETAHTVRDMMMSAVKKAVIAQIPNYTVAGKTGTAQIPNFKTGGYTEELIHNYVGFAPARNPRFVILIKLDKPQGAPLAGYTVVPAFREIAEFLLNYYSIPPDDLPTTTP